MRSLFGAARINRRPDVRTSKLFERARDSVGIARELNGRRVGEILPLTRNRRADYVAKNHADRAYKVQHAQRKQNNQDCHAPAVLPIVVGTACGNMRITEQHANRNDRNHGKKFNPKKNAYQPHVEAHVTVDDMTEFMRDDALKLVAR